MLFYDQLTGLYNRRFYNQCFQEVTAKATQNNTPLSLLLLDLDNFTAINDANGHHQGDAILQGVSELINERIGLIGYPIRYAGDEFVLLLPELSKKVIDELATGLVLGARERQFKLLNRKTTVNISISIGIACWPEDVENIEDLFECAQTAVHAAKEAGRDRIAYFDPKAEPVLDANTLYRYFPCPKLIAREHVVKGSVDAATRRLGFNLTRPWTVLTGPPGIGKSRLLREIGAGLQGRVVLSSSGLPHRIHQPFGFLSAAINSYLRHQPRSTPLIARALTLPELEALAPLLPELAKVTAYGSAPGETGDPHLDGFYKALRALGEGKPPPMLFDDFQWVDAATLRVLQLLLENDPESVAAVCVQEEETAANKPLRDFLDRLSQLQRASIHRLESFTPEQTAFQLEAIFPKCSKFTALSNMVANVAKGRPLIVEEALKYLVSRRYLSYRHGVLVVGEVTREQFPDQPEPLLEMRIGLADDEARLLMAHASVLGGEFDFATLVALEGLDEGFLRGMVERARRAHFFVEDWGDDANIIRFVSPEVQSAVYRMLDEEERRSLHRLMAQLRERQSAGSPELLLGEMIYHFGRAGDADQVKKYQAMADEKYAHCLQVKADDSKKQLAADVTLSDKSLVVAGEVVRHFDVALKNIRVRRTGGLDQILSGFEILFAEHDVISYSEADGQTLVNGRLLPGDHRGTLAESLRTYGIRGLSFRRGLTASELRAYLELMCMTQEEVRLAGGLGRLLASVNVKHIAPNEKIYVTAYQKREEVPTNVGELRDRLTNIVNLLQDLQSSMEGETVAIELKKLLNAQRELSQKFRDMGQFVDVTFLQAIQRDWGVLARELESGTRVNIETVTKAYLEGEEEAIDPLLRVISSAADPRVRRATLALLRKVAPEAMARFLLGLNYTQLSDEKVQFIASLEAFQTKVTAKPQQFAAHPVPEVRRAALSILVKKDAHSLSGWVTAAVEDEREDVATDAIVTIGRERIVAALPALLNTLKPGFLRARPTRVRAAACVAVTQLVTMENAKDVVATLRDTAKEKETKLRTAAKVALDIMHRKFGPAVRAQLEASESPFLESMFDNLL